MINNQDMGFQNESLVKPIKNPNGIENSANKSSNLSNAKTTFIAVHNNASPMQINGDANQDLNAEDDFSSDNTGRHSELPSQRAG